MRYLLQKLIILFLNGDYRVMHEGMQANDPERDRMMQEFICKCQPGGPGARMFPTHPNHTDGWPSSARPSHLFAEGRALCT